MNDFLKNLVGSREKFSIESRIFHISLLIIFSGSIIGLLINVPFDLKGIELLFSSITVVFTVFVFVLSRYRNAGDVSRISFISYSYAALVFFSFYVSWSFEIISIVMLSLVVWQMIFYEKYHTLWFGINIVVFLIITNAHLLNPDWKPEMKDLQGIRLFYLNTAYLIFSGILFSLVKTLINQLKKDKKLQEKKTLQLREMNREINRLIKTKGQIISILSHDLQSPLSGIISISELEEDLDRELDIDMYRKYFRMINSSAKGIHSLLDNLLAWSKLQTDKIIPRPQNLDMKIVVDRTIELNSPRIDKKQLNVENKIPEQLMVFADREMIYTVVRNLISNAIKFSEPGKDIVIDESRARRTTKRTILFRDEGIGMTEMDIHLLQNADFMKSREGTSREKGNGLGFVVSREFVKENNGFIEIESNPGEGSVFYLSLPPGKDQ